MPGASAEPLKYNELRMPKDSLKDELDELIRRDRFVFEFLHEAALDGIWFWDFQEQKNEWVSPRFRALLGYQAEDTFGLRLDHLHPEDMQEALRSLELHRTGQHNSDDQTLRYRKKDGATVWIRCRGLGIRNADGECVRILGANTDVTELKKAQQRIEEQERALSQSTAGFQQFARAASHDLREPLRMISSFSSLLEKSCIDDLSAQDREYLGYVRQGAERMHRMLDSLHEFALIHYEEVVGGWLDLGKLFGSIERDLATGIGDGQGIITVGDLPTVWGEEGQLYRAFFSIVSNGLKFCKERPARVDVSGREEADSWVVNIQDNGIGLDVKFADKIFDMFRQLNQRELYEGAGAGLALSKRIIEQHGGSITVESALGEGSVFRVRLPKPN